MRDRHTHPGTPGLATSMERAFKRQNTALLACTTMPGAGAQEKPQSKMKGCVVAPALRHAACPLTTTQGPWHACMFAHYHEGHDTALPACNQASPASQCGREQPIAPPSPLHTCVCPHVREQSLQHFLLGVDLLQGRLVVASHRYALTHLGALRGGDGHHLVVGVVGGAQHLRASARQGQAVERAH